MAVVCALVSWFVPGAHAEDAIVANCAKAELRSVTLAIRAGREIQPDLPVSLSDAQAVSARKDEKRINALGPVLGSMDSQHIDLSPACKPAGVVITATITRSADYHGAVLKYATWRPEVAIVLAVLQPNVVVMAVWKMRLSDGTEVHRAQTPPYPVLEYPVIVTKTVP